MTALCSSLEDALSGQVPYELLSPALHQLYTLPEYRSRTIIHSVSRSVPYTQLPQFLRMVLSEKRYAELTVTISLDRLQIYPYNQMHCIVQHTKETPLSYYLQMLALLLKAEKSYDTLPNFTAVDILNLLGIGRNQFLNITKEVRSKLWWKVHRSIPMIKDALPKAAMWTVTLDPFWEVWLVDPPNAVSSSAADAVRKLCDSEDEFLLWKRIHHRWKTGGATFVPTSTSTLGVAAPSVEVTSADAPASPPPAPPMSPAAKSFVSLFGIGNNTPTPLSPPPPPAPPTPEPTPTTTQGVLQPRPYFYACELPKDHVNALHRKGLIYPMFTIDPFECISVPPLENFVMNRTSDEPQESLLYRILSTIDDRTTLDLLAQLLSTEIDTICASAEVFVRLGLAKRTGTQQVPDELVECIAAYKGWDRSEQLDSGSSAGSFATRRTQVETDLATWGDEVAELVSKRHCQLRKRYLRAEHRNAAQELLRTDEGTSATARVLNDSVDSDTLENGHSNSSGVVAPLERSEKRIALLYDASLTGLLMMTNLSSDSTFKQHAVTLFEVGKLTDEAVEQFEAKLEQLQRPCSPAPTQESGTTNDACEDFQGEARKYVESVVCLGKVISFLRRQLPESMKQLVGTGIDMLKVESLNELEAKTRYLVLGRKYLSFFAVAPLSTLPLIDLEMENLYGPSIALAPSPWMMLALYRKMNEGPDAVFFPFGQRITTLPDLLAPRKLHSTRIRLQPLAGEAEITHVNPHSCLITLNEATSNAPLFAVRVADVPKCRTRDGTQFEDNAAYISVEITLPFTASDCEVHALVAEQIIAALNKQRGKFSKICGETAPLLTLDAIMITDAHAHDRSECCRIFRRAMTATGLDSSIGYVALSCLFVDLWILQHTSAGGRRRKSVAHLRTVSSVSSAPASGEVLDAQLNKLDIADCNSIVIESCSIVDIGFGFPLCHRVCCTAMLTHLKSRVFASPDQLHRHNHTIKAFSDECLQFISAVFDNVPQPSGTSNQKGLSVPSAAETIRKLGLDNGNDGQRSRATRGPSNQKQLRTLGGRWNNGAPFPPLQILFRRDGSGSESGQLHVQDLWDPLIDA